MTVQKPPPDQAQLTQSQSLVLRWMLHITHYYLRLRSSESLAIARPHYIYTNNYIILTLADDLFVAISHPRYLKTVKDQLEMRLKTEVHCLRNINEALVLSTSTLL